MNYLVFVVTVLFITSCSPKVPDIPDVATMQKAMSVSMGCSVAAASDHFSSFLSVAVPEAELDKILASLPPGTKTEDVWRLIGDAESSRLKYLLKQSFDKKDKFDSTHAQPIEDFERLLARGLNRIKSVVDKKESYIFFQIFTFEEDGMSASRTFKIELTITDSTGRQGYRKFNFCN